MVREKYPGRSCRRYRNIAAEIGKVDAFLRASTDWRSDEELATATESATVGWPFVVKQPLLPLEVECKPLEAQPAANGQNAMLQWAMYAPIAEDDGV